MKKGKLLILLVALLSLAVIFLAACEGTTEPDEAATTSEVVSETAGESGSESESAGEETVEHSRNTLAKGLLLQCGDLLRCKLRHTEG